MAYKGFPTSPSQKQSSFSSKSLNEKLQLLTRPRQCQHEDLLKPYERIFTDSFNFSSTSRAHVTLQDKPAGLTFKTSLNQDQSMLFLFQKRHTSKRDKAFSLKTSLSLDSRPPLRFHSISFFNFNQETSSLSPIDHLWFQSRLKLVPEGGPEELRFQVQFR